MPSASRQPSQPPSSGTELDYEDDFDIDSILREEEQRIAKERGDRDALKDVAKGSNVQADDGDDAAMWEQLQDIENSSVQNVVSNGQDQTTLHGQNVAGNDSVTNQPPVRVDDDEAMWDVVRELEAADVVQPPSANPATTTDDDDDFESMYIDG